MRYFDVEPGSVLLFLQQSEINETDPVFACVNGLSVVTQGIASIARIQSCLTGCFITIRTPQVSAQKATTTMIQVEMFPDQASVIDRTPKCIGPAPFRRNSSVMRRCMTCNVHRFTQILSSEIGACRPQSRNRSANSFHRANHRQTSPSTIQIFQN